MNLCVIPARGGSKRIPKKNIRDFHGKPIIAWSIESAQRSECFDRIVVSTDDLEIADVATKFNADVPFIRPSDLSDDFTGTLPVVLHAVNFFKSSDVHYENICCLYATAPLLQYSDIRKGLSLLNRCSDNSFVFTATEFAAPIERALRIDQLSKKAFMLDPSKFNKRSQDLQMTYYDAGQFYWGSYQAWQSKGNIFEGSFPLLLPRWRVQDIDTEDDWLYAENLHKLFTTR